MLRNLSSGIGFLVAFAVAPAVLFTPRALLADPFFINVDEYGRGFSFHPPVGSGQTRLRSYYSNDPYPGGGNHILTYLLPFPGIALDVLVHDVNPVTLDDVGDLIRFDGQSHLLFYSLRDLSSSDGIADVTTLPPVQTITFPGPNPGDPPVILDNVMNVEEIGPEGNADALFIGSTGLIDPGSTLFELIIHSDLPDPRDPNPLDPTHPLDPDQFITGIPEPSSLIIWGVPAVLFLGWTGMRNCLGRRKTAA